MYDIVGKRRYYFIFSTLITIPGLIFIALGGLRPSIDFTGGTEWEVRFADDPGVEEVRQALASLGHADAVVTAEGDYLSIRTAAVGLAEAPPDPASPSPAATGAGSPLPGETDPGAPDSPTATTTAAPTATPAPSPVASPGPTASPGAVAPGLTGSPAPGPTASPVPIGENTEFGRLRAELTSLFGAAEDRRVTSVGPTIGSELIRTSIILIVVGELFIFAYLWIRFGFRYGTTAIVALLHDVIVVVGVFAIGGYLFNLEFDALFVTALLTIIGFSVHDTIVVFDRIRENRIRHAGEPFGAIVNHSILQTLGRSINTSMTVVITLSALLLLGPATIRTFTLALLIGIVSGTYSSIFNASQLLVAWHEWDARRRATRAPTARSARAASR